MEDKKIREIIDETANVLVLKLKAAGILQSGQKTAYEKTETLLWQYKTLKQSVQPYARRIVEEIDACMAEVEREPYADVIRLYYFEGNTNAACAAVLLCDERTCRRNRKKLVQMFSARLASDDFIRELLL